MSLQRSGSAPYARTNADARGAASAGSSDRTSDACSTLTPGELVADRFVVRGLLGQGSTARVYEAEDRRLGRRVALKVGRTDAAGEALEREAQALAAIRHPGLVAVFDVVTHRGLVVAPSPSATRPAPA